MKHKKVNCFSVLTGFLIFTWMGMSTAMASSRQPIMNRLNTPSRTECGIGFSPECQKQFIEQLKQMPLPEPVETSVHPGKPAGGSDLPGWLVMMYACSDQAVGEILDLFAEKFGSDTQLDVLVLNDTTETTTQLYYVDTTHTPILLADWGERDMSDYSTLRDLLQYGADNYPRDHTMLTIYGHGGAWMGVGGDNTGGYSLLGVDAMKQAIQETGSIDILVFTAPCLMGNLETAYQLKDQVDIYVGSPESSNYMVWYEMMDDVQTMLSTTPDLPLIQIAENLVQWTYENNLGSGNYEEFFTMAAYRTDCLEAAATEMTQLVTLMRNHMSTGFLEMFYAREETEMYGVVDEEYWQLCDIIDFLQSYAMRETDPAILAQITLTITAIEEAIIDEWHGVEQEGGHGMTIYFPQVGADYLPEYDGSGLDFPLATSWAEFLTDYRNQVPPTATPNPTPTVTPPPLPPLDVDPANSWTGAAIEPDKCLLADINGDSLKDLVVNLPGSIHQIYLNTGHGFDTVPCWELQADPLLECNAMAAADLGNDGFADLLIGYIPNSEGEDAGPCLLFANTTGLPGTSPVWTSHNHRINDLALGDINKDGNIDLVVGSFSEPDVAYFGDGNGGFMNDFSWQTSPRPTIEIALADMNADGYLELITLDGGGKLRIYPNYDGNLFTIDTWQTDIPMTFNARGFDIADWDNDGFPEIALARCVETTVVLRNVHGVIQSDPAWESIAVDPTEDVTWGDLDGDGYPELYVGNFNMYWTGSEMFEAAHVDYVYRNTGGNLEQFPSWVSNTLDKSYDTEMFDIDGDGDLDLFAGVKNSAPRIFINRVACDAPGVHLEMPKAAFHAGDTFGLKVILCAQTAMPETPVFVMMDVYGECFFAPSWRSLNNGMDYFVVDLEPGWTELEVIPEYPWPASAGALMDVCVYSAMTDAGMTQIIGEMDTWFFSCL